MKSIIISPHTDDAIFSIGSFISQLSDVTIASPFAGIPEDEVGKKKHTILRAEHKEACKIIGAKVINGDFFDDVYPDSYKIEDLKKWLVNVVKDYDQVYIPLGIHHPDHILITNLCIELIDRGYISFYQDLPYAIRYPKISDIAIRNWDHRKVASNSIKLKAVSAYKSQVDEQVIKDVMVTERIWKV